MGSYVEKTLGQGEKIVFKVTFHWLFTALAYFYLITLGWIFVGIFLFFKMMIYKWTTEQVLTEHRFIKKIGWIMRKTEEMRIDRMEEVNLHQSVIQRIFDTGNIVITGTGTSDIKMDWIDQPLIFQRLSLF